MISPEHPKDLYKKQGDEKGRTVKHGVFQPDRTPRDVYKRQLLALESGIRLGNELSRTRLQRMPHHVYPCLLYTSTTSR